MHEESPDGAPYTQEVIRSTTPKRPLHPEKSLSVKIENELTSDTNRYIAAREFQI